LFGGKIKFWEALLAALVTSLLAALLPFCSLENLSLCSSAEAGIALNLFLNFEQK